MLNPTARSLVLALQVAQHGPDFGQAREDLERAIAGVPESTWVDAANLGRLLQAETSMAAGLLSVRAGLRLCEMLGLHLENEVAVEGRTRFHAAQGLQWLMETRGIRAKGHYLRVKLLPPTSVMRSRVVSARSGRSALVWAYGVRLARIGWHAPRAAWLLARLRRERRGS